MFRRLINPFMAVAQYLNLTANNQQDHLDQQQLSTAVIQQPEAQNQLNQQPDVVSGVQNVRVVNQVINDIVSENRQNNQISAEANTQSYQSVENNIPINNNPNSAQIQPQIPNSQINATIQQNESIKIEAEYNPLYSSPSPKIKAEFLPQISQRIPALQQVIVKTEPIEFFIEVSPSKGSNINSQFLKQRQQPPLPLAIRQPLQQNKILYYRRVKEIRRSQKTLKKMKELKNQRTSFLHTELVQTDVHNLICVEHETNCQYDCYLKRNQLYLQSFLRQASVDQKTGRCRICGCRANLHLFCRYRFKKAEIELEGEKEIQVDGQRNKRQIEEELRDAKIQCNQLIGSNKFDEEWLEVVYRNR